MQISVRSYLAAGVAAVGASAIALSPVAPPLPDVQVPATSAAVQLSGAWTEAFNTASENATKLAEFYYTAPHAALQQAIVNKVAYLGQLLNDPTAVGTVLQSIGADLQKAYQVATFAGDPFNAATSDPESPVWAALERTLDPQHTLLLMAVNGWDVGMSIPDVPSAVVSLMNFAASPLSGVLIGALGPVLSPVVELVNSVGRIMGAASFEQALQAVIATPANVIGSIFNGTTLNLDAVLPLIAGSMPEGMNIKSLSLELGGLFSVGSTGNDGLPGGSLLNALTLGVQSGTGSDLVFQGHGIGPCAALTNLSQIVARAIGWDGVGNPLTKLTFPKIEQPVSKAPADPGSAELPAAPGGSVTIETGVTKDKDTVTVVKDKDTVTVVKDDTVKVDTVKDGAVKVVTVEKDTAVKTVTDEIATVKTTTSVDKVGGTRKIAADSLGKQLNSTVKKATDGLKNSIAKPAQKASASKAAASSDD
ncbi:hypothetical protein M2272_003115 [Mycobacterium frederiksbergense]|uniref:PE-PGRS family protein n=1 Tax=Mycolicibacterium frederiksbergense TaxID=117567 RepID=A0ABT6L2N0_9MYCO|nr:outer membrane porin GjpA [Mycolicibacterium frederiksbergense]MDH6196472.1 hypothetical protein [Mycolicibacterium frederiksbergense]